MLGTLPEIGFPDGFKLQISDQTNLLVERVLEPDANSAYLYARVVGSQDEQFLVTIIATDGQVLTLPAFAYLPK